MPLLFTFLKCTVLNLAFTSTLGQVEMYLMSLVSNQTPQLRVNICYFKDKRKLNWSTVKAVNNFVSNAHLDPLTWYARWFVIKSHLGIRRSKPVGKGAGDLAGDWMNHLSICPTLTEAIGEKSENIISSGKSLRHGFCSSLSKIYSTGLIELAP